QKTAYMKTIMEAVEEEYEVDDKEVLEQSIANFLAQLLEKNLILLF
ncbi:MAG: PqqD family peptide modification chaperone, partial [Clostridia bacterium]|nr:PqqD family peptide modification chaperone [Clostridia bacterium]